LDEQIEFLRAHAGEGFPAGTPPLVPPNGPARVAALRFLRLKPDASDDKAHLAFSRLVEREHPRGTAYYQRFVVPYEPIVRSIVIVSDPDRWERIRIWREHPARALGVPYEAVLEGGDPEEVYPGDQVREYTLTFEALAADFGLSRPQTLRLMAILRRSWKPTSTAEDWVSITAALTGCAPEPIAARRALKNLVRRSPDGVVGRPRGSSADRIEDVADELRERAGAIRSEIVRICKLDRFKRTAGLIALFGTFGIPESPVLADAIHALFPRVGGLEPRRVLVFVLTRIYRQRFPGLREARVSRLLSVK